MKVINILLGETLDEVREGFQELVKEDIENHTSNLIVLSTQPGTGKSTFTRNFIKDSDIEKIGVVTARHNLLKEFEADIPYFNHWYGFSKICEEPELRKLTKHKLTASVICSLCKRKTCKYKEQFKDKYRCGIPNQYLNTRYIEGFDLLFIEEKLNEYETYTWNEEDLINGLKSFKDDRYKEETIAGIERFDYYYFFEPVDIKGNTRFDYLKRQQLSKLRRLAKEKKYKEIKPVLKFNAISFQKCLEHGKKIYHEPMIFKAFELSQVIPVVLNHASFSVNIFKKILKRYEDEYRSEIKVKIYTSNISNKNTTVYKITNKQFSKNSLRNYKIPDELFEIMEALLEVYNIDEIGIITYLEFIGIFQKYINKGITNVEHFYNSSGINKLENCEVLIICGTPRISHKDKIMQHNGLFDDDLPDDYYSKELQDMINEGSYPNYIMSELRDIDESDKLELYDAIHRNRGLIHDRIIILFGDLPYNITKEFKVIEMDKTEIDTFINNMKEITHRNADTVKLVDTIIKMKNEGLSPTKIARILNIRKENHSYNVDYVQKIFEIDNVNQKEKYL